MRKPKLRYFTLMVRDIALPRPALGLRIWVRSSDKRRQDYHRTHDGFTLTKIRVQMDVNIEYEYADKLWVACELALLEQYTSYDTQLQATCRDLTTQDK